MSCYSTNRETINASRLTVSHLTSQKKTTEKATKDIHTAVIDMDAWLQTNRHPDSRKTQTLGSPNPKIPTCALQISISPHNQLSPSQSLKNTIAIQPDDHFSPKSFKRETQQEEINNLKNQLKQFQFQLQLKNAYI